jgi:hypothetical protein
MAESKSGEASVYLEEHPRHRPDRRLDRQHPGVSAGAGSSSAIVWPQPSRRRNFVRAKTVSMMCGRRRQSVAPSRVPRTASMR